MNLGHLLELITCHFISHLEVNGDIPLAHILENIYICTIVLPLRVTFEKLVSSCKAEFTVVVAPVFKSYWEVGNGVGFLPFNVHLLL